MDVHPILFTFVYAALVVVALLILAYWITYTRGFKTPLHVGKNEGIAIATHQREHDGKLHF
jgi:hypothetical protein